MKKLLYYRTKRYYIVLVTLIFLLVGCANQQSVKKEPSTIEAAKKAALPTVSSIEVSDNTVSIVSDSPFEYTVYKPEDPFKVIVDLSGVVPGENIKPLEFTSGIISEIKPTHIATPQEGTRLEILLSSPSDVTTEYSEGKLMLKVNEISQESEEVPATEVTMSAEATDAGKLEETVQESEVKPDISVPAQYIESIDMLRKNGKIVILIKGDGSLKPEIFPLNNKLVVDIEGVSMNTSIPREVPRPLKGIRWGDHGDKIRIVLDFEPDTTFDVVSLGDTIEIALASPYTVEEVTEAETVKEEQALQENNASKTAPEELVEGKYTGTRISLDFQDADIVPIFRLLADVSGYNVVIDPGVKGKITMKLINVPWDQALDIILKTFNLDKEVDGNIIRIAPVSVISREREQRARMAEAMQKAEPLVTKVFPISYADVKKVRTSIEQAKILSKRGSISVDERISSLIIKDVASNMSKIKQLVDTLDKPTPQVMIEARIVEVNTSATREFGIQWGFFGDFRSNGINRGGVHGFTTLSSGPFTGSQFMVDFPASGVGALSGSGIAFGFLDAAGTAGLDFQIAALETSGNLKIVSNPRIITIDNKEATISQGKSIPVRKLTSEGTVSTEFKDIKLELKVKPHITPEGSIILNVNAKKEELDPTIPSVEGVPGTDKKEAKTNVIIKDGETLVIGGIYKTVNNDSQSGLPVAKDIPVLGWLFKNKKVEKQTNELLIFITPRIVKTPTK